MQGAVLLGAEPESSFELAAEMKWVGEPRIRRNFLEQAIRQGKLGGGFVQADAFGIFHGAASQFFPEEGVEAGGGHIDHLRHLADGDGLGEVVIQVRQQRSEPLPGFQAIPGIRLKLGRLANDPQNAPHEFPTPDGVVECHQRFCVLLALNQFLHDKAEFPPAPGIDPQGHVQEGREVDGLVQHK